MEEEVDAENKLWVISRAQVCEQLKKEGYLAEMDAKGNVVVSCPDEGFREGFDWTLKEAVKWEQKRLSKWRKQVHERVLHICEGAWVSVKQARQVRTNICRRCHKRVEDYTTKECPCTSCRDRYVWACLNKCSFGGGGPCKGKYVAVFDKVLVTSLARVSRAVLLRRASSLAVLAAELLLMDWRRPRSAFAAFPRDLLYYVLNIFLANYNLHVKRKPK